MPGASVRLFSRSYPIVALLMLSACGGGGGSDNGSPPSSTPPPSSSPPPPNNPAPPPARTGTPPTARPGQFLVFQDRAQAIYKYDLDTDTVSRMWEVPSPLVEVNEIGISPDGKWIAFSFDDWEVSSEIWVLASDGGSIRRVTEQGSQFGDASGGFVWSPGSLTLAYHKGVSYIESEYGTASRYGEVWAVDRDENNRRRLSAPVPDPNHADQPDQIKWSPDGRYVSWLLKDDERIRDAVEIYDTRAGGSNLVRIFVPADMSGRLIAEYEWAPDSSRLAFSAVDDNRYRLGVFTVKPDGTQVARIDVPPLRAGQSINKILWSPNGSRIALICGAPNELCSAAPDGTGIVKLNAPLSEGTRIDPEIVWAPDGSRIAYRVLSDILHPEIPPELYTVRPDGSDRARLNPPSAADRDITAFKWSPDSARLAYRRGGQFEDRKLYVVRADGTDFFELNGMLAADPDPGKGVYPPRSQHFDWSPDGTYLFHVAETGTAPAPAELFTLHAETKQYAKLNDPLAALISLEFAAFAWSSDGSRAAYVVDDDDDRSRDLFLVAPNGAIYKNISKSFGVVGIDENISWSP